jgi:hypothetical protein
MPLGVLARRVASMANRMFPSENDLHDELQTTLAALAAIEYRHERDRERLAQRLGPQAVVQRLWEARERRYQAEREPYLRKLERLQQRIRSHMTSGL